jgi:hypothetical protein
MKNVRTFATVAAILLVFFSACRKEEGISPQTGNLFITFRQDGSMVNYEEYLLYTEAAYFSLTSSGSRLWLRRGAQGFNRIDIRGLNPGNYVIVVRREGGQIITGSVQVTARRTNEFTI